MWFLRAVVSASPPDAEQDRDHPAAGRGNAPPDTGRWAKATQRLAMGAVEDLAALLGPRAGGGPDFPYRSPFNPRSTTMEEWLVMGGAVFLICLVYPPLLGVVIGAGGLMLATVVVYKLLGG
jgi:hypothetical protein